MMPVEDNGAKRKDPGASCRGTLIPEVIRMALGAEAARRKPRLSKILRFSGLVKTRSEVKPRSAPSAIRRETKGVASPRARAFSDTATHFMVSRKSPPPARMKPSESHAARYKSTSSRAKPLSLRKLSTLFLKRGTPRGSSSISIPSNVSIIQQAFQYSRFHLQSETQNYIFFAILANK